jgi:hypothetical protein
MLLAAMVAGAPFFFGDGEGDGVSLGVSPVSGVVIGLEEGVEDSAGFGEGEGLRFFFFLREGLGDESGPGVGEEMLFFGDGETVGSGVFSGAGLPEDFFFRDGEGDVTGWGFSTGLGLGEAFFFFEDEGDGDFSGVGDGFGAADFSTSSVFFGVVELLRCFRGVGVGVGAKIFLILLPNDCSACAGAPKFVRIVRPARAANPMANARRLAVIPSTVEP